LAGEVVFAASEEGRRDPREAGDGGRAASEAIASQCVNALLGSGERSMKFEIAELVKERDSVEACRTSDKRKL
jgi:hypothetical protein